jgi:hypothetical protein
VHALLEFLSVGRGAHCEGHAGQLQCFHDLSLRIRVGNS